jgi:hypothetical protein
MDSYVNRLATILGLGAALLAGALGVWQNLSFFTLILRCLVAGALVFAFVRLGGDLAGRSLLRGVAEDEVRKEEQTRSERKAA